MLHNYAATVFNLNNERNCVKNHPVTVNGMEGRTGQGRPVFTDCLKVDVGLEAVELQTAMRNRVSE